MSEMKSPSWGYRQKDGYVEAAIFEGTPPKGWEQTPKGMDGQHRQLKGAELTAVLENARPADPPEEVPNWRDGTKADIAAYAAGVYGVELNPHTSNREGLIEQVEVLELEAADDDGE